MTTPRIRGRQQGWDGPPGRNIEQFKDPVFALLFNHPQGETYACEPICD